MNDVHSIPNPEPNPLAGILVATIRQLSVARAELQDLQELSRRQREIINVSLEMIADLDRKLDRARDCAMSHGRAA